MRSGFAQRTKIVLCCAVAGIVCGAILDASLGQPSSNQVFEIGRRPLADVILELEKRHGWIITYEDPPYQSPTVVEEVTVVRESGGRDKKMLAPRERVFAFDYRHLDPTRPREILSSMLEAYNVGNDDAFGLVQEDNLFHVIPTRSGNTKGIPTERRSLLDVRVTIEPNSRSAYETLLLILLQVSSATGERVNLGTSPTNLLDRSRARLGAVDERARDVLVRALAATKMNLSWRLLCTARSPRECAFNLHTVQAPN